MKFRSIEINDKNLINQYIKYDENTLCDYSFTNLFIWKNYYKTMIYNDNDTLYLKYIIDDNPVYFLPLGNIRKGIDNLIKYTRLHNEKLRISNIHFSSLKHIPTSLRLSHLRGNDDYIYSTSDLATLAGKKFKAKRNLVNSFQAKYNYSIKIIDGYISELDNFIKKYSLDLEYNAIINALYNFKELNLFGLYIIVDNEIIGFTLGTIYENIFITHFEKSNHEYSGSSQMLNYLIANHFKDKIQYINREEDLGILGLREAKLSYNPIKLINCYSALYIDDYNITIDNPNENEKDILITLWKSIFKDEDFSIYYLEKYFDRKNTHVIRVNNEIKAMCIIMQYNDKYYLYALCTDPNYRGLDFGKTLINHVKEKYNKVFLFPASKDLINYYKTLGFNKRISLYESKLKYDSSLNIDYNDDIDINHLLNIYNTIHINKLYRDESIFKKILYLGEYKVIHTQDSYAIYNIDNDKLIIHEIIGDINLCHMVMKKENYDSSIIYSYTGEKPIYIMDTEDDESFIYCNLLFN